MQLISKVVYKNIILAKDWYISSLKSLILNTEKFSESV